MTKDERPQEQPTANQQPPAGSAGVSPTRAEEESTSRRLESSRVHQVAGTARRRPRRNPLPPVTTALVALCIFLAVASYIRPSTVVDLFFYPPVAYIEPWRFITSAFLHSGVMHIFFNLYALLLLGMQLEPYLGKARFLTLYLASAIGGNLAVLGYGALVGNINVGVVGASGAIFGLFGAMLVVSRAHGLNTSGLAFVLLINFAMVFVVPNISWQSHVGGFLMGALVMYVWHKLRLSGRRLARPSTTTIRDVVLAVAVVLASGALGALAL